MKVEIWADFACPWCCIGRRRFTRALERYEHADDVEVVWRAFELDPDAAPKTEGDPTAALAAKYAMSMERARAAQGRVAEAAAAEGLEFHLERVQRGNTFDAHRLARWGDAQGAGEALRDRIFAAYFSEGRPLGDRAVLAELAGDVGLDARTARAMLDSDELSAEVRADEMAAASLGITAVPCFVFDRAFGVSGAQSPEVIGEVLERARTRDVSEPAR